MSKGLKTRVLLSVLALGVCCGVQGVEAAPLPDNPGISIETNIGPDDNFCENKYHTNLVTAFYTAKSKVGASTNEIFMQGSTVDGIVAAYTNTGSCNYNRTEIYSGNVHSFAAGSMSEKGAQNENSILVEGGSLKNAYGAYGEGKLTNNHIVINNGTITEVAAGAWNLGGGAVTGNTAQFNGGNVESLIGGASMGLSQNNKVTVNGGNARSVEGGISGGKSNTIGNEVIINGGTLEEAIGGEGYKTVKNNKVTVMGGTARLLMGADVSENGTATGNQVNVAYEAKARITEGGFVYGARTLYGKASSNSVQVLGDLRNRFSIIGVETMGGSATGNKVEVINNYLKDVSGAIINGKGSATSNTVEIGEVGVSGRVYAAITESGTASKNVLTSKMSSIKEAAYGAYTETGAAKNNTVNIGWNGENTLKVYGAYSNAGGLVSGNKVNISGGLAIAGIDSVWGAYTNNVAKATSNTVELKDTKVYGNAYGAQVENGAASKNVLTTYTTDISGNAYGAYATGQGNVTSNGLVMHGNYVDGIGYGGFTIAGTATKNYVIADSKLGNSGGYIGGFSENGKATYNKVTYDADVNKVYVLGGGYSIAGAASYNQTNVLGGDAVNVVGGISIFNQANKNKVTVNNATAKCIVGGISAAEGNGVANYNTVDIKLANVENLSGESTVETLVGDYGIYGAFVNQGIGTVATKNVVNYYMGHVGLICGAKANEGDVTYNTVNFKDPSAIANYNNKQDSVYGGYTKKGNVVGNVINMPYGQARSLIGGETENGDAISNKVNISGYAFVDKTLTSGQTSMTPYIIGGNASYGKAVKNTVSLKNLKFLNFGEVYGGMSDTEATSNKVTLVNASCVTLTGGFVSYGDAKLNAVSVTGNSLVDGNVTGGTSFTGSASNNTVTVGGYSEVGGKVFGGNSLVETSNNVVNINGNAHIYGDVIGGNSSGDNNKITLSGNSRVDGNVVVCKGEGIGNSITMSGKASVGGTISGYQKQKGVPKDQQIISGAGLILDDWSGSVGAVEGFDTISFKNVSGKAGTSMMVLAKGEDSDLSGTTVTVNNAMLSSPVQSLSLISSEDGKLDLSETKLKDGSGATVGTVGRMKLTKQDGAIFASYAAADANPQTKALAESRTAAAAFVNQGTEIVEHGINQVAAGEVGSKTFAAVFGNASRYNTGSHVKVNGWSEIVGIGNTVENGKLTYGAFFENGTGNYRTFASAMGMPIRGYGEATYNGGGVLAKKKLVQGAYVEGAVRAGRLQNKLNDAVLGGSGLKGYDVSTGYYGAHIGLGKEIKLNENSSVDVYLKYLFTHHSGKNYRIDGDEFRFDSMNSQRTRLGFRINSQVNNKAKLYYGLVWDYEMDGKADNKVQGYSLHTPSLKGSTVFLDLGAEYKLNEKWSLDLNAKGYAGERRGVTGSAQVTYNF